MTVNLWFYEDLSYDYFNCTKHLDYSYFKDKEKNIIDKLTKEAKRKEEAKKYEQTILESINNRLG